MSADRAKESMTPEELIGAARERAGLDEFDSESFREGLEVVVGGFLGRPDVPDSGRQGLRENVIGSLVNRLRVADHTRRHPEILEAPIEAPIVVMGMPRTGTTAVSYLLDLDPRLRSLLNWEAVDSVPPPTTETLRTDPRCLERKKIQQQFFDAFEEMPVHWEWADGPTECIFIQQQDFKALSLESMYPSEAYSRFILECDMTSAYAYHKRVLQVLQSRAPGRWSLKMPSHSLHFAALMATYPDARVIWTHRDPFRALASLCATVASGHMNGLGRVDVELIRKTHPHQIAEHVRRPMKLRPQLPADTILDVYATDFFADPLAEMRRIYDWLGLELSSELEAAMRDWMRTDSERQARRSTYSLEQYGLTREAVAHHFEEYIAAYPRVLEG